MKKVLFTLSVLLIICFNSQAQSTFTIALDSVEDGAKFYVNPGQIVTIKASANITTGFRWTVDYNKKQLRLVNENYVSDPVPEGWVGGGGTTYFEFEVLSNKTSSLSFLYSRGGGAGSPKKIYIISLPVSKASVLGHWFQANYEELVVRDGVKHPHYASYTKGEHTLFFMSNQKGISKDLNSETGLHEESHFKWTLKKNKLTIKYIVGSDVQDSLPEVYTVTPNADGLILISIDKEDDSNFIYSKLVLKR